MEVNEVLKIELAAMSEFNKLSEELLYSVKTNKETTSIVENLATKSFSLLEEQLSDDKRKKAFWINSYNAYFQILRKEHNLKKPEIYKEKRIFALNCGAKSCPPIAFYSVEGLEDQLELATLSFLEGDTEIKESKKEVHITALMKWFLKDFGGRKGIRKILKKYLEKDFTSYKLVFKPYSWDEELDNYDENNFNAYDS